MAHCDTAPVHLIPTGRLIALVGNPNCGKSALFNLLTGSRQKVANYAGVTVERKEGQMQSASGHKLRGLDLPGAYSLSPRSPDERVTLQVLQGAAIGEKRPDLVVCVADATNLRRNLRLVLAVQRLGLPTVLALNMTDLAAKRSQPVDTAQLSAELGMPVVATVGVQKGGARALLALLDDAHIWQKPSCQHRADTQNPNPIPSDSPADAHAQLLADHARVRQILQNLGLEHTPAHALSERIDNFALHPILGPWILLALLFLLFQAVFAWAQYPMDAIQAGADALGAWLASFIPAGYLQSFLIDGVIAGAGGVLVFLPQILILFFFILVLEESGYLPRAAFILDRLMGSVGLSGRSFIPLLSSYACAIPGIMATRTISDPRDRLVTILIAPLTTCSARLPVYALLIAAFIPRRQVLSWFELQGLVLFALYLAGIIGAMAVAYCLKIFTKGGGKTRSLMMELPDYHWPTLRNVALGLWQRAWIFLRRVGGIILLLTIALWLLSSFPTPPAGATAPAIEYSLAGTLGHYLSYVFAPIGFNWQISIALVPGIAAREVMVGALGTVYALSATGDDAAKQLAPVIAQQWSLATGLSLLAWYVFAPQCLSTLAAVKRETGGWRIPAIQVAYMFVLAYAAAFITYHTALYFSA